MPRNAQGIYSLPAGNPVVPGTLIETTWANPTMSDIAAALTGSLPRNGSAGMTGPLILNGDATLPLEAVPLQQLNATVGGTNSFLPAGAVQLFAMAAVPSGWLECNGSAVSRTTYANLFAAIGTLYGAGNGTTTFNLPDLRGEFVRGWDNGRSADPGRAMGTNQAAANNPHTHTPTVSNPAHSHTISDPGHGHTINDPGHKHLGEVAGPSSAGFAGGTPGLNIQDMSVATTGISINGSATGISVNAAAQATSVSIAAEGIEARPRNVAMVYAIKAFGALQTDGLGSMAFQNKEAVNITGGSGVFTTLQCTTAPTQPNDVARLADIGGSLSAVLSSDPQVLLVDNTTPSTPILRPQTNVPNGMAKLDAAGFVPSSVLNITDLTFLGNWSAATDTLPTGGTYVTGDYYVIDVAGNLTLHTSSGNTLQACNVGDQIIFNSATPGWWYFPAVVPTSLAATAITFAPGGTIAATNVQTAIGELDSETQAALALKANTADVLPLTGGTLSGALTVQTVKISGSGALGNIGTSAENALQIDATAKTVKAVSPYVLAGNGPAFSATGQVIAPTVNVAVKASVTAEVFDTNNNYDAPNSRFTPTVAGYYQFNCSGGNQVALDTFGLYITLIKNGVTVLAQGGSTGNASAFAKAAAAALAYMNGTTDFVEVYITPAGPSGTLNVICSDFNGAMVRAA